jgi:hypothetical protein
MRALPWLLPLCACVATNTQDARPAKEPRAGDVYGVLRLGELDPKGDYKALDPGFWGTYSLGRRLTPALALEASFGWFDITGGNGNGYQEIYGAPLCIDLRVDLPVRLVEPYVGVGGGGVWCTNKTRGLEADESNALLWDAFAGIQINLGGFALGAEVRHVQSGDLDAPGGNGHLQLEGNAFMLTGKLAF